jgi:hypothetical protein
MDTAWIQVFLLTMSECVAPAGKTVCQEQNVELQFLTQADCQAALEQLVTLKQESDTVIIDPDKASCVATARKQEIFVSLEAIQSVYGSQESWKAPEADQTGPSRERTLHQERLASLPVCGESSSVPCKMGDIIIEEATGDSIDVWRRQED